MNIKPLHDRVVIKQLSGEQTTAGGIIIPDSAQEKPTEGVIVAVGTGKPNEPLTVKVGDKILFSKRAGTEVKVNGETYLIMRELEIFGILKE